MPQPQFDFLKNFIEKLFDDSGFGGLDEVSRKQYITLFTTEAERRLGLALMPLLSQQHAKELVRLIETSEITPQQLAEFWKKAVPDFENVVKNTLQSYAEEFKSLLAKS